MKTTTCESGRFYFLYTLCNIGMNEIYLCYLQRMKIIFIFA